MVKLLKWSDMSMSEQALAPFAQGILNRKGHEVFIDIDHYLEYLDEEYETVALLELIELYKEEFIGAVCYDPDPRNVSINMAATISAAYDILGVPRELVPELERLGIPILYDLERIEGTRAGRQMIVFESVKHRLAKDGLVHQVVREGEFHLMLRDFSICRRWACIYTDQSAEDREFRRCVLEFLDKNIPVYGWTDDEISFVKDVSSYGDYVIPMDWSSNHSYLASGEQEATLKQSIKRTEIREGKHYLALVVSDGDNVQWLERGFTRDSIFGQRRRGDADYKVSWTFSPSLVDLAPSVARDIFKTEKHDEFIASVSGIGYSNMLAYPIEHLPEFTRLTARAMERSDLGVICLNDDIRLMGDDEDLKKRLSYYTEHECITGGIWQLEPEFYEGGEGRVFVCDGKPFISVRWSFWHRSFDASRVTDEWIDEFADKINTLSPSENTDEGYTVINIHPWTINAGSLDRLVSKLGDHIELVYADELIELYKKNVISKGNI